MRRPRERLPGEGSVFRYCDSKGMIRFGFKFYPSPGASAILRRLAPNGAIWTTYADAAAALRAAMSKSPEWVDSQGEYLSYGADARSRARDRATVAAFRRNGIKGAREARGLTGHGLAAMSGVDRAQLRRIEQGKDALTLRTIERVADALGLHDLTVGDLLERFGSHRANDLVEETA